MFRTEKWRLKMFGIKRRRTLIRALSYTVSAFMISIIFSVVGFVAAYKFRMNIEYSYERALSELSEHVDSIDIALQKGYYASTSAQLVGLSAQIWSDAGAANTDISQMPLTNIDLGNTTKFLSQVGDYSDTLGKQLAQNRKITETDRTNIQSLSKYAKQLSTQLSDIENELQSGRMSLFKSESVLNASNLRQTAAQPTIADGFLSIEKSFSGLPSMIYDGPFSDSILKKTALFIKDKPEVSRDKAKDAAAAFLGAKASSLNYSGDTAGNLPTYNFNMGTVSVSVTKAGGYVVRMLDSRAIRGEKLGKDAAIKNAANFLKNQGINSMTQTYYLSSNGISTINFAYMKNGVTFYPDLIKVGLAMDNGSVVSFDATGYIMNHTARSLPAAKIPEKTVRAVLNPHLKVDKESLALIPTDGGGEALCYEYKCTGDSGQAVIDYFNVKTGVEQQVLILIDTPGGTLVM
jgi:spore germination protein